MTAPHVLESCRAVRQPVLGPKPPLYDLFRVFRCDLVVVSGNVDTLCGNLRIIDPVVLAKVSNKVRDGREMDAP